MSQQEERPEETPLVPDEPAPVEPGKDPDEERERLPREDDDGNDDGDPA